MYYYDEEENLGNDVPDTGDNVNTDNTSESGEGNIFQEMGAGLTEGIKEAIDDVRKPKNDKDVNPDEGGTPSDGGEAPSELLDRDKVKSDLESQAGKKGEKGKNGQEQTGDTNGKKGENKRKTKQEGTGNNQEQRTPKNNTPKKSESPPQNGGGKKGNIQKAQNIANSAKQDGAKGAAKEIAKEAAKEVAKKAIKKSGAMRWLAMIPPIVLFWAAVVIIVIIIVIGFVFFIISMPGMISGKLKEMGMNILKAYQRVQEGAENQIDSAEIAKVANYLESMGYDLKGEGFITAETKYNDDGTLRHTEDGAEYDEVQDVWRDESDEIIDIGSEPIFTYLVSDKLCYLIKNFNQNLETATGGNSVVQNIINGIITVVAVVVAVAACIICPAGVLLSVCVGLAVGAATMGASYMAFAAVGNPNWGTGLISIYHEGDEIGTTDGFYSGWETGYITLDPDTRTLEIARGWSNDAYTFSVDGWSGRYGTPLEFLLSVHIATKMPDLAMEIATTFDTDVQVILHSVDDGDIIAGYKIGDDKYVSYNEIDPIVREDNNFFENVWNGAVTIGSWFGWWNEDDHAAHSINPRIVQKLAEDLDVPHSENCTCCSHIALSKANQNEADVERSGNHKADSCTDCTADNHSDACKNGDSSECGDCSYHGHTETCKDQSAYYGTESNFSSTAQSGTKHYVCDACVTYMTKIVTALKKMNDSNWESYTPYISKVTKHWFRDMYLVIDNAANTEVVKNDEEYELETGERWTIYETYTEKDSNDGNIPEGFTVGDYKLYEYKDGNYTLSTRTKAEVDELNERIADGDTSVAKLVKKSLTEKVNGGSGKWTAYQVSEGDNWSDWTQLDVNTERADDMDEALTDPDVKDNLYYKENRPDEIIQVEDGQRGVTNKIIKDMFINKSYYKYDGSVERANAIYEDKIRHTSGVDMNDEGQVRDLLDKYNTSNDPRNEELISKVSLAKDSLAAFSILQNTKTLDADYIYRDFKELIVELDYFDKEDLSDKISQVMQWPLPETGTSGWPIRKYEKGEDFYGTLINSKVDLRLLTDADIKAAERILERIGNEIQTNTPSTPQPVSSGVTGSVPAITMSQFVDTGYRVHAVMEHNGWHYCNLTGPGNGCNFDNAALNSNHVCGLDSTIQEAINGHHNTCCSTYVSWVLKEAGFDLSGINMHGPADILGWCEANGWKQISDYNQMEPGDLFFTVGAGHVQMLGYDGYWLNAGSSDAINKTPEEKGAYDASQSFDFLMAMRPPMNASQPFEGYTSGEVVVSPVTGKIIEHGQVTRKNEETGKYEEVDFIKIEIMHEYLYDTTPNKGEGYLDCISINDEFENKITDRNRRNLEGYDYFYDEYQGVIDGFVLYIEGFDLTLFDGDGAIALVQSGETDTERVTRYEANGVQDLNDDLREARAIWQEDAKAFAIPVVKVGEDWYIKEGTVIGKTLSDEGRVPRTTRIENADGSYTEEMGGNGNYMRLILRDYQDEIIEDVETYFDIVESEKSLIPQPYEQEDGDLELLAKFLHKQGCQEELESDTYKIGSNAIGVSKAIGYTVLNRALTNYNNYGVTLKKQINAAGQYSGIAGDYCDACIKNAEWCLTYDCGSVYSSMTEEAMDKVDKPNKTTNVPMTREVNSFKGVCECEKEYACWWWVDANGNNSYDTGSSGNDIFFCKK